MKVYVYLGKILIMTDASQDYRDNMYGMSGVQQFLKKKKKNDDAVKPECGKADGEECGATLGGGESKELPKKKSGPSAEGEKNEVLTKEEAEERAVEFEENRQKAVPMVNKTRKQLEEEDEQAKADYKKYGRNKPASASNKSKY